ncbi:MAG: putative porin [Sedimentisphaerales bacterium]|nr:putative porin [Sedimentisphaerales bacterium]
MSSKKVLYVMVFMFVVFGVCKVTIGAEIDTRIEKLEKELETLKKDQSASKEMLDSIPGGIFSLTGFELDFTYSYQWTDDDAEDDERNNNDIEGRIAFFGQVNDEVDLVFRVGADKTLGDGFEDMDAWVDLAYVDYHPGKLERLPFLGYGIDFIRGVSPIYNLDGLRGIHILGGKFEDPFYHPGDSGFVADIGSPEGFATVWTKDIDDELTVFSSGGGFWVQERETEADTSLWALQIGATRRLPILCEDSYITAGASYFNFGNIQGREAIGDFSGNTSVNDEYETDYDIINAFCEIGTSCYDIPIKLFGDYVINTSADSNEDQGYLIGFGLAEHARLANIRLFYDYMEIQANAVVGAFSDNAFDGGTHGRGHKLTAGYQFMDNAVVEVSYVIGEKTRDDVKTDFTQVQVDLAFQF